MPSEHDTPRPFRDDAGVEHDAEFELGDSRHIHDAVGETHRSRPLEFPRSVGPSAHTIPIRNL